MRGGVARGGREEGGAAAASVAKERSQDGGRLVAKAQRGLCQLTWLQRYVVSHEV